MKHSTFSSFFCVLTVSACLTIVGIAVPAQAGLRSLFGIKSDAEKEKEKRDQIEAKWSKILPAPDPGTVNKDLPPVKEEGFTGPVHQKYAGKVVFSKSKIERAPANDSEFVDKINLGEPLFARPYMKQSMENAMLALGMKCDEARKRSVLVQIGDAPRDKWIWVEISNTHPTNFAEWMSFVPGGDPDRSLVSETFYPKDKDSAAIRFMGSVVPGLRVGENVLTFHTIAHCFGKDSGFQDAADVEAATGVLKIMVTEADKTKMKAMGTKLSKSPHPENAALKPLILKTVADAWKNEDVLDASVSSTDWGYNRHPIHGHIMSRSIGADVLVHNTDTGKCSVFNNVFEQASTGLETKFVSEMEMGVGNRTECACP